MCRSIDNYIIHAVHNELMLVSLECGSWCGTLLVSTPDSGLSGLVLRAGWGDIVWHSRARHFTLTVPLSTQVYKWVLANLMLGVALQWTSIPTRGKSRNTPSNKLLLLSYYRCGDQR